jgi:hypothetical protein
MALGVLLAGYAIVGKAFAYIGVPPVYVGEIVFALGIISFLNSKCAVATFATLPSLLFGVLFGWAIIRTLPYLGEFGVDALRDSVLVVYGGFALFMVALLLERPERILLIIRFLRVVARVVIVVAPCLLLVLSTQPREITALVKPQLLADHLAGAALLILLGFMRASVGWRILLLIGIALVATQTRGGMLAIIIPLTFAFVATGRLLTFAFIVVATAGLASLAYQADLSVSPPVGREISARQLVGNFSSAFVSSGSSDVSLENTKVWRITWWDTIIGYTFEGPYFWSGKGFGINLAADDGFANGSPLRSPHNAHFTMLARAGVPGLALWLLTLGSWSATLLVNMVRARRLGHHAWADLFVFIFCYALAFIIDGTFDVALEGPMVGIWFWSLFGVGIGATMIYRASLGDTLTRQVFAQSKRIDSTS